MSDRLRWFRFSLRTLFVAVTLLCVWLGWQFNLVRVRREARQAYELSGLHFTSADAYAAGYPPGSMPNSPARISPLRRMFGDVAIQEIWYEPNHPAVNEDVLRQVRRTFPEADVREVLYEPCHPGCFPAGTLVLTPDGERLIETIAAGEPITTFAADGTMTTLLVSKVFVTDNRIWRIVASDGTLFTTKTQPLCLADGTTRQTEELSPGDRILRQDDGELHETEVRSLDATTRTEKVYNLILDNSEMFSAGGFIARSKPPAHADP